MLGDEETQAAVLIYEATGIVVGDEMVSFDELTERIVGGETELVSYHVASGLIEGTLCLPQQNISVPVGRREVG